MYDPSNDSWSAIPNFTPNGLDARQGSSRWWSGSQVVFFDEKTFGVVRFDPVGGVWSQDNVIFSSTVPARYRSAAALVDGKILLWGGPGGSNYLASNPVFSLSPLVYDLSQKVWSAGSAMGAPAGRFPAAGFDLAGGLLVWGGTTDPGGSVPVVDRQGWIYNPNLGSWIDVSPVGGAGLIGVAVPMGGRLYMLAPGEYNTPAFPRQSLWVWSPPERLAIFSKQ
jgi:hypothetical protein